MFADMIIHNAKLATNASLAFVEALSIKDGGIQATGASSEILRQHGPGGYIAEIHDTQK